MPNGVDLLRSDWSTHCQPAFCFNNPRLSRRPNYSSHGIPVTGISPVSWVRHSPSDPDGECANPTLGNFSLSSRGQLTVRTVFFIPAWRNTDNQTDHGSKPVHAGTKNVPMKIKQFSFSLTPSPKNSVLELAT